MLDETRSDKFSWFHSIRAEGSSKLLFLRDHERFVTDAD